MLSWLHCFSMYQVSRQSQAVVGLPGTYDNRGDVGRGWQLYDTTFRQQLPQ